jgi:hypothetical protein
MELNEALRQIDLRDQSDRESRARRLVDLMDLLPGSDEHMAFSGQASIWLFEDVKASWIYGDLTATILAAHAFSMLQLAHLIRLMPDAPDLLEEATSLEQLAGIAISRNVINIEMQSRLIRLHDLHRMLTAAKLHEHQSLLDDHLAESETVGTELPLLADAFQALNVAIDCVRTQT